MWELLGKNAFVLIIVPPAGNFWCVSYMGPVYTTPLNFSYIIVMVWAQCQIFN